MKQLVLIGAVFSAVISCQAQYHGSPGFFGGYADGVTSVPTGKNTFGPALRMAYDDFTFYLAGTITGFEIIGRDNTGSPVGMYYEIRTGVTEGNGGTLLYSGNTPSAAAGDLPLNGSLGTPPSGTGNYRWYDGGLTTPIQLPPGTYWIGLAPLQGFGSFEVASTQGLFAEGTPIDNGRAYYYDSSDPAKNFISQGGTDFGLRVVTTATVVPEPGTWALFGLGGVFGYFGLRRHRSSQPPRRR
jgi:hypothetical protein